MSTNNSTTNRELREMVKALEKLQARAATNRYQFLAYLLDMSRMEAVSLLAKQQQQT